MVRNIIINHQKGNKYAADDIPKKVLKMLETVKRFEEKEREDLREGQVVVILEGSFTSMRGVFVKRLVKNLVLVGVLSKKTGEVTFTVLNQRYVHPVSTFISIEKAYIDSISVDEEEINNIRAWTTENAIDLDIFDLISLDGKHEELNVILEREFKKTKGLRTYFKTPFTIPREVDPMQSFY